MSYRLKIALKYNTSIKNIWYWIWPKTTGAFKFLEIFNFLKFSLNCVRGRPLITWCIFTLFLTPRSPSVSSGEVSTDPSPLLFVYTRFFCLITEIKNVHTYIQNRQIIWYWVNEYACILCNQEKIKGFLLRKNNFL